MIFKGRHSCSCASTTCVYVVNSLGRKTKRDSIDGSQLLNTNSNSKHWFISLSPFLIGRMFLREPSWKCSAKLYSGSKKLRSTCSGNILPVRRSLPLIGWEQSSPVDEEKIKIKMDDCVARFFTRFGGNLFICWLVGGTVLSPRPRMR